MAVLAATGSTGNNTHDSATVAPDALNAVEFVVEVAGSTPTVTYKLQGTLEGGSVADVDAGWVDLMVLPSDSDTAAKTFTVTAAGTYVGYLAQAHSRFCHRFRVVTSSNTNVTYRANLRQHITP